MAVHQWINFCGQKPEDVVSVSNGDIFFHCNAWRPVAEKVLEGFTDIKIIRGNWQNCDLPAGTLIDANQSIAEYKKEKVQYGEREVDEWVFKKNLGKFDKTKPNQQQRRAIFEEFLALPDNQKNVRVLLDHAKELIAIEGEEKFYKRAAKLKIKVK